MADRGAEVVKSGIEIERISEGQRFTTRLLSEQVKQPLLRTEAADFRVNTPH